jgi:hypothetical protein
MKSERHRKKKSKGEKADDLRPEYDLRELLRTVPRANTQTVFGKAPTWFSWTGI